MVALILVPVLFGCEEEFKPPPSPEGEVKKPASQPTPAPPSTVSAPVKEEPPDAAPEPTTEKEIDLARNTAILDGRYEDALRYCNMGDITKKDEQSILGCVLTACRLSNVDSARQWSKSLGSALAKEARKVCLANKVVL